MEMVMIGVLAGLLIGGVVAFFLVGQKKPDNNADKQIVLLHDQIGKLTDKLDARLDRSQEQMRESLTKQLGESAKLIRDVTQRLTTLDETNKRVVNVADELKTLQNVLQNPKQRGVLGEYYLETVLQNVMPPDRFKLQHKFSDGEIVDAVIYLDKGKMLPIDSKYSLENYNRLVEEKDKTRREVLAKAIVNDLKQRINETSKYIREDEGTMDFAFMFIPSEAVFYDLLINKVGSIDSSSRDLIEYAFRDKKVIIVSPTSFLAYLQTVLQGLRSLQIEEQAKEIQKRVGLLGRHLSVYDEYMNKLGNALGTTVNHYNRAHKELKKIDKDVVKIAGSTESIKPLELDKPTND